MTALNLFFGGEMGQFIERVQNTLFIALCFSMAGCIPYYPQKLCDENRLLCEIPWLQDLCVNFDDISQMAVLFNPDLQLARDDVGVSNAQLFAAGLIPDPQLSATTDFPTNFTSEAAIAYTIGLTYDFKALVLIPSATAEAGCTAHKMYLTLLWQEWQMVSQARLLYVKIVHQRKALALLIRISALLKNQYESATSARAAGSLANDVVLLYLTALQDNTKQISDLAQQLLQNEHGLNALIGLEPDIKLILVDPSPTPSIACDISPEQLFHILSCRTDLLALQAGYQSQEWRVRKEILSQLPDFAIGPTRARDNTGIYSVGYGLSMSVPIFNRNRGNIVIEHATRDKLYDEYQTRINAAYAEVKYQLALASLFQTILREIDDTLDRLETFTINACIAFEEGNIDLPTYVAIEIAHLNKRVDQLAAQQGLMETRVTLQTLLDCHFMDGDSCIE